MEQRKTILILIVFLLLLIFPFMGGSYLLHVFNSCIIFAVAAIGVNLITGYTGQTFLAQAAFFGIGAYTSSLLTLNWGVSPWVALPIAGIVTLLTGVGIGLVAFRARGHMFAILTLMVGLVFYSIFKGWREVTGGFHGISGIPTFSIFGIELGTNTFNWYFVLLVFFLLIVFFTYKLFKSYVGRAFIAVREDEVLAASQGINPLKIKLFSFACCCFLAGIAGSFFAHYVSYISPDSFTPLVSFEIIIYVLFGGAGTFLGPIVGTFTLRFILQYLHIFAEFRMLAFGILVVLIIIFLPGGIYPEIVGRLKRRVPTLFRGQNGERHGSKTS